MKCMYVCNDFLYVIYVCDVCSYVCMQVCVYVCMCDCMRMCDMHACMQVYMCVYMYVMDACAHVVCMCVYMYVCMYICNASMCACVCVCARVFGFVLVCTTFFHGGVCQKKKDLMIDVVKAIVDADVERNLVGCMGHSTYVSNVLWVVRGGHLLCGGEMLMWLWF